MIFPSGNRKNLDTAFNPLRDDPRSPYYEPELKKNVKKAQQERANDIEDPRSLDYQPEFRGKGKTRVAHEWAVAAQAAKMSGNKQSALNKGCSVASAQAGGLSDIGGTVRQMKSATSNSIWDNDVIERIKKGEGEVTKGEQIKADNQKLAEERQALRKQNFNIDLNDLKAALGRGDLQSGHRISTAHTPVESENSNYSKKIGGNQQSLFGNRDYEAIPEKTVGETIKESAKARREKKDRSWEKHSKAASTRQKLSSFFSNLEQTGEGQSK